jgi:hypothetical protein
MLVDFPIPHNKSKQTSIYRYFATIHIRIQHLYSQTEDTYFFKKSMFISTLSTFPHLCFVVCFIPPLQVCQKCSYFNCLTICFNQNWLAIQMLEHLYCKSAWTATCWFAQPHVNLHSHMLICIAHMPTCTTHILKSHTKAQHQWILSSISSTFKICWNLVKTIF